MLNILGRSVARRLDVVFLGTSRRILAKTSQSSNNSVACQLITTFSDDIDISSSKRRLFSSQDATTNTNSGKKDQQQQQAPKKNAKRRLLKESADKKKNEKALKDKLDGLMSYYLKHDLPDSKLESQLKSLKVEIKEQVGVTKHRS